MCDCGEAEVLLVDDIPFNLLPLKAMVEDMFGRKCDEAVNGEIAVNMYKSNIAKKCCQVRYKAIFTDIQMPVMDGLTEARQIRSHERTVSQSIPEFEQV